MQARLVEPSGVEPPAGRGAAPVLLVTELFPPAVGGSAALFENIYSRLPDVDVVVLTNAIQPDTDDERPSRCSVVRRTIATRQWGVLSPRALSHHLRVAREIKKLLAPRGGIVHCGRALPEGLAACLACVSSGTGYLCWTHGEELAYASGSRELAFLMRRVHHNALAILANSRNTARALEAWGVSPRKISVVYPGVDTERFRPRMHDGGIRRRLAPKGGTLLLSVGRLQRRKGHDLALAAVHALLREHPDLRYVIVGDGEDRAHLERLAIERGISAQVIFAGEVPETELPFYYAAADIFLLPNRVERLDFEGFGIVFLEAAASGIPAIGGASGGVPEAIADGLTGLLVSGTDAAELAAAIRRLVTSVECRRRMGRAARERVLREFTWQRAAAAVARIHAELGR